MGILSSLRCVSNFLIITRSSRGKIEQAGRSNRRIGRQGTKEGVVPMKWSIRWTSTGAIAGGLLAAIASGQQLSDDFKNAALADYSNALRASSLGCISSRIFR